MKSRAKVPAFFLILLSIVDCEPKKRKEEKRRAQDTRRTQSKSSRAEQSIGQDRTALTMIYLWPGAIIVFAAASRRLLPRPLISSHSYPPILLLLLLLLLLIPIVVERMNFFFFLSFFITCHYYYCNFLSLSHSHLIDSPAVIDYFFIADCTALGRSVGWSPITSQQNTSKLVKGERNCISFSVIIGLLVVVVVVVELIIVVFFPIWWHGSLPACLPSSSYFLSRPPVVMTLLIGYFVVAVEPIICWCVPQRSAGGKEHNSSGKTEMETRRRNKRWKNDERRWLTTSY